MNRIFVISVFLFLNISLHTIGQTTVLHRYVELDSVKGKWGPNLSNYMHFYGGFGYITPVSQQEKSKIIFGKSLNFELGLNYKKRITNWIAVGSYVSYDFFNYRMEQKPGKTLPDTLLDKKQKVYIHNLSLSPYMRLNFGKRGNKIGNYIDFGIFYNKVLANREIHVGTTDGIDKLKIKDLSYITNDYYGVFTNIGVGKWVLYAKYNLSKLVYTDQYQDLPPLTIGVRIGFF